MKDVLRAALLGLTSLFRPGVLWHLVWPMLVATLIWVSAGVFYIGPLTGAFLGMLQTLPHVGDWFIPGGSFSYIAASGMMQMLLWLMLLPLILASALLLITTLGLPMMLDRVSATDYADLRRREGGSVMGSLLNALRVVALFLVLLGVSLPLWFIPGGGMVVTVLLSAWLNRRCFEYDALMHHASAEELRRLPREHRTHLNLLALLSGLLTLVPIVNLLTPAWVGLAFVHYLLNALRVDRDAVVTIDVC